MFGKNDKKSKAHKDSDQNPEAVSGLLCLIANGTRIEGDFNSDENIRVDGKIIGDINCKKKLVMGETGIIEGAVSCQESSIQGVIKGQIKCFGRLHLHATSKVEGKIIAHKLIVDEGAGYSGECLIGAQHLK